MNEHISSTYSHNQLISFSNFNVNSFLSKLINTLRFSKEKNFHFLSFWECVYKVSKNNIYFIFSVTNINSLHFCKLLILFKQLLNFGLSLVKLLFKNFELFQKIKLNTFRFIEIFFKIHNLSIQILIVIFDINLLFMNLLMFLIQLFIPLFVSFTIT